MSSNDVVDSSVNPSVNWYVQLSERFYKEILKHSDNFPGLLEYELGNAKMKRFPNVGDCIILLAKKHEVSKGFVYTTSPRTILFIDKLHSLESAVYTGRFYRRNWTISKSL